MAKKKKDGTVKPSGLAITRNGNNYTFTWKRGDKDYGWGQQFQYRKNGGAWVSVTVSITATSVTITNQIDATTHLPNVKSLQFRVQGRRKKWKDGKTTIKPKWSGWATSAIWNATVPTVQPVTYENDTANSGTFSWSVQNDPKSNAILCRTQIQTCFVRNGATPPDTAWGAIENVSASGSRTISEQTEDLATGNLVRWFRVRSVGTVDVSGWKMSRHSYGDPNAAVLQSASAVTVGSVTRITAVWSDDYNTVNPIDMIALQYAIAKPTDEAMAPPADGWSTAIEVKPNGAGNKVIVNVENTIDVDECLWVRVKGWHDDDNNASFSNAMVAQYGDLGTPTLSAAPDTTTGDVAITITETTACTAANTAIFYRADDDPSNDQIIAILQNGTTTATVNVPDIIGKTTTCFGAYAFVGTYDGTTISSIKMRSGTDLVSTIAAVAPDNVTVMEGPDEGTVRVGWEWTWTEATKAEISWSDKEWAWESTDGPSDYSVEDVNATSWIVAGLEVGKRWFFKVRLIDGSNDKEIVGPWSDTVKYDLSTVPDRPALTLSKNVINEGGTFVARWASTDQDYAEIALVTFSNGDPVYGDVIAHVDGQSSVEIDREWVTGETYYLAVRVTTTNGTQTVWSDPVSLYVAEPVSISIAPADGLLIYCNFSDMTIDGGQTTINSGQRYENYRSGIMEATNANPVIYTTVNGTATTTTRIYPHNSDPGRFVVTREMPLTVTVIGAGASGTTTVSLVRAEDYHLDRPDDSTFDGYEGEVVTTTSQIGEEPITINVEDLIGHLDDGTRYNLVATVTDTYEQTASESVLFTVNWTHKAEVPGVSVVMDKVQRIAKITPIAPDNYQSGDTCDIYRITADQPELIIKGGDFGTTYVDPYPAFGDFCGHRIVTITKNGDYTTADGLGWYDADYVDGDILEDNNLVIDVDGDQIVLPYNLTLNNTWNKDFKRTSYLGGAVQGDWNPAITRDLSAGTVLVRGDDIDKQLMVRDLAGYAGVAHVRTPDGSSLTADVQINEQQSYDTKAISYTMTIKAIDPSEPVGMTLEMWNELHPVDE